MAAPILAPAGIDDVMFFIPAGTGAPKPGGPDTAPPHIDTGRDELRFLALGTTAYPEICEYADTGTLNAITGAGPDDVRRHARHGESLDSWDGHA